MVVICNVLSLMDSERRGCLVLVTSSRTTTQSRLSLSAQRRLRCMVLR